MPASPAATQAGSPFAFTPFPFGPPPIPPVPPLVTPVYTGTAPAGTQLFYSSAQFQTTVAVDSGSTLQINAIAGLPQRYPFKLLLEWGTANQEVAIVTSAPTGDGPYTFTGVLRGCDGGGPQIAHAAGAQVNHGVSAADFFQVAPVFNVCDTQFAGGADPTGNVDSTQAIIAAINACNAAGGGVVYFPPGTFTISSALPVYSNMTFQGAGRFSSIISQTSRTANVFSWNGTNLQYVNFCDLQITGPGSGSGTGIRLVAGPLGANPNVEGCNFSNLLIQLMGGNGFYAELLIVSKFDNVIAQANGSNGFSFGGGVNTALTFDSCYANGNTSSGYDLESFTYCSFNGCAADSNAIGYFLFACDSVSFNGCGCESSPIGWEIDNSYGISLVSCFTFANTNMSYYVTGGSSNALLAGVMEQGPVGATFSIKTDPGTNVTLIGYGVTTGISLASGTTNTVNDGTGELTIASTSFLNNLEVFGTLAMQAAAPVTLTAGTTTVAPIQFANGTNLTTAAAGAVEYDGAAFYATSVASSRQVVNTEQIQILTGTRTFTANTSAQAIFNATANGTLSVAANTTYEFECLLSISGFSASSHSINFSLTGLTGTAATFTSVAYMATLATTAGGAANIIAEFSASASAITASTTGTIINGFIRGVMRINAAGTVTPALSQVTATAAATVQANSFFRCWPIGSGSVTAVGNWS